ncbi:hypothetical protein [Paenibacillus chitinolyticus]|uniref:hypothetical protein n=1 Tax=Paenibacillus chitinolyticus TaxID=79263 RepID=UPI003D0640C4
MDKEKDGGASEVFPKEKERAILDPSNNRDKKKWYLKNGFVLALCVITPPIGYIHVLVNRKHWEKKEMLSYLLWATVFTSFWLLKFISKEVQLVALILALIFLSIGTRKK